MNNPLVSICIPAYKCEKTIEKAVNSALSQTYKNIEIIIIDDNSPDNTFKILESIKDNRIHLYKNEHTKTAILCSREWLPFFPKEI